MLVIDLPLTLFLNDLVLLTCEQRPKNMCLRLLQCRRAKGEVDTAVPEIGMSLFIGDPELVEHSGVSKLTKTLVYFLRCEARLLRRIHKVRHYSGLGHQDWRPFGRSLRLKRATHSLCAQHVLNFAWDFVGEPGAAG